MAQDANLPRVPHPHDASYPEPRIPGDGQGFDADGGLRISGSKAGGWVQSDDTLDVDEWR